MFRTLALAVIAALSSSAVLAGSNEIFMRLAAEDDDRTMFRAVTRVGVSGIPFYPTIATNAYHVALAAQDDDRIHVRALTKTDVTGARISTKSPPAISALEVALIHAIESDNRILAAHLMMRLGY